MGDLAAALASVYDRPQTARRRAEAGARFARRFTLESLESALRALLADAWKVNPSQLRAEEGPVPSPSR